MLAVDADHEDKPAARRHEVSPCFSFDAPSIPGQRDPGGIPWEERYEMLSDHVVVTKPDHPHWNDLVPHTQWLAVLVQIGCSQS